MVLSVAPDVVGQFEDVRDRERRIDDQRHFRIQAMA